MLKHKKDKQPVASGQKKAPKGGAKSAKAGTARLMKGKYCS